ncbi:efflux RND transporter periplasmic adaptor subunit [Breznakiella homolactica]|uniref:Efflux RND transporter periplasmic adaptor subunit n=1 Tax=Breznakiella homolactica TaxID=2798577 RepID=A0A7T8BC62_9SPIR|nr:efflux RND transporter periplasmic adaptor subunit [Breznakiella homolactica]QQO11106.1 efflux RND transporter periplasmic adaptor subunit [Breznakiella homolactica]
MKNAKVSRIVTIILVVLTVLIGVLTLVVYIQKREAQAQLTAVPESSGAQPAPRPQGQAGARSATVVRVRPVELGSIENYVTVNGDVLTRSQVAVYPTVAGKISEVRVRIGDYVRQGQIVAAVDPSRPGDSYSHSPVTAPISGTVLSVPVNPGDTVSTQTAVCTVGSLSDVVVETFIPERFAAAVRRGLPAAVFFEAIPQEVFAAEIDEVSPVLDPASRTLRIRLRFLQRDDRIIPGMFSTVHIVTNTRSGVPLIPRESVISTYGSWIVFTVDENNIAHRREIQLGLENEDFIEVTEGLEDGELVVSAGQNFLSDNETVRIVD